jgi:hypothetical protein
LVELLLPEHPVPVDELCRHPERLGPQPAPAHASELVHLGQPRVGQHAHVLGHGGQGHVETRGQLADGALAPGEMTQDCAPRGVGEGAEGAGERVGIINHMV